MELKTNLYKKQLKILILFLLCIVIVVNEKNLIYAASSDSFNVDSQAKLFVLKCTGCHTIGGGDLSGPDLKRAASYPQNELISAISRMQERVGPLSSKEINELANFIKSRDAGERIKQENEKLTKLTEAKSDPPDVEIGRGLFTGAKPLKNGGTSCISCHSVAGAGILGGGKLGPSLENAFKKFGKHNLASAIENSNWKIMKEVYKAHPITKQEAIHLVGFFRSIQNEPAKNYTVGFLGFGIVGCLLFYGLTAFFYRNRNTGVRNKLRRK